MAAIPPLFRCPISLDLLRDPVTLCTGQTYDRSSIEKWLGAGNTTCPVTMQKLHDPSIVPNHTLRHLINDWLRHVAMFDDHDVLLKMMDLDDGISALKLNLESPSNTLEQKVEALRKVVVLSDDLPLHNSALIQLDFFRLVLDLIFRVPEEMISIGFAEQALICALKLLPFSDLESINDILANQQSSRLFVALFEQGSFVMKKSLCCLLEAIASSPETRELCAVLGKSGRLIRQLITLVNITTDDDSHHQVSAAAIKAISALSSLEPNREAMVKQGLTDSLITCILANAQKCNKTSLAPMAMRGLELVLASESAKEAVVNHPSGVNAIVKMVFRVSDHQGSDEAVNSLMIICRDSLDGREAAICAGVLTQLLLLLQSQCSGRTKSRARMLLKLLRSMWADDPKHAV
nr:U-box domain-containing protein 26-like [Ipomoea batatas]GME04565.1 U-box domain-containing protein 26-like [Ipomoea batatas]